MDRWIITAPRALTDVCIHSSSPFIANPLHHLTEGSRNLMVSPSEQWQFLTASRQRSRASRYQCPKGGNQKTSLQAPVREAEVYKIDALYGFEARQYFTLVWNNCADVD